MEAVVPLGALAHPASAIRAPAAISAGTARLALRFPCMRASAPRLAFRRMPQALDGLAPLTVPGLPKLTGQGRIPGGRTLTTPLKSR